VETRPTKEKTLFPPKGNDLVRQVVVTQQTHSPGAYVLGVRLRPLGCSLAFSRTQRACVGPVLAWCNWASLVPFGMGQYGYFT